MSYISWITNIGKMDLNLMAKIITSLGMYFVHCLNRFFVAKNALYIINISTDLLIPYNKSKIIQMTYFGPCLNRLAAAKNPLYMAKTVASLLITCNKSKLNEKNNLANKSYGMS